MLKKLSIITLIIFTITNFCMLGYIIYSSINFPNLFGLSVFLPIAVIILTIPIITNIFLIIKSKNIEFFSNYKAMIIAYFIGTLITLVLSLIFGFSVVKYPKGGYDFHPLIHVFPFIGVSILGTIFLGFMGFIIDKVKGKMKVVIGVAGLTLILLILVLIRLF